VLAEFALDAAAVGVEGEIALQMRPADLPPLEWQVAVGPPAIAGDDRPGVGEQRLGAVLVTVGLNGQDRVALGDGAPERALAPLPPPAGLIHVQRPRPGDPFEQVLTGLGQRIGGAGEDRIDGADRDP
jgi:hypothetical protein